jgi:opacity protein-like surface antigen
MKAGSCLLLLWSGLVLAVWCTPLAAQEKTDSPQISSNSEEQASNALVLTGTWFDAYGPTTGRSGEFDWIHSSSHGNTVELGAAGYQVGSAHWMFGQGGASFWPAPRWNLDLQTSLGAGSSGNGRFVYQKYSAKVTYKVSTRLYLESQEEFMDIGTSHGHLLGAGVTFAPTRHLATQLVYRGSVGGNLGTDFTLVRIDLNCRAVQPFAGFAGGKTAPEVFQLQLGQTVSSSRLVDGFGGIAIPVSITKVIVAGEWIDVGPNRTIRLTGTMKVPIGRR